MTDKQKQDLEARFGKEFLTASEMKETYKKLILPILKGETEGIYPTDNAYTKWANLQDNIEVFIRSSSLIKKEHGELVADRVQKVIDALIESNSLKA